MKSESVMIHLLDFGYEYDNMYIIYYKNIIFSKYHLVYFTYLKI